MKPRHFASAVEAVSSLKPQQPLMCLCPDVFRAEARRFVAGFPGDVHYAVKANPHPGVLHWLSEGGVKGYDVASIAEIELVRREMGQGAHLAFNHPVKSRADIDTAYRLHGVRDFVIDHDKELAKLAEICDRDATVQVRIAKANPDSEVDLNAKFGCDGQTAAQLMRQAGDLGFEVALAMHVGWQSRQPKAWAEAITMGAGAAAAAGVTLRYANLGGGYPSVLMPRGRTLEDFFDVIRAAKAEHLPGTAFNCEPGSALVWRGCETVAQVVLRKDDRVYLNDGVYGSMAELKYTRVSPPHLALSRDGQPLEGELKPFTICGPTCDSVDMLPAQVDLPEGVDERDHVVFGWMGAYSNALLTTFNGLGALEYATVDRLAC